ncbi:MAG: GMC family oxidoreductase N-terminal domain-containing protein [Proteobacteria bacterium]|nr:GMC family oxidoreductase N-terminal domain-containing protein [Pseudomonadota bacterium]
MTDREFDYVIVGGGTAGCVLASRLSADPSVSVLVLEAGPDYRGLPIRIPAAVKALYRAGTYHWGFQSRPEAGAAGRAMPYKLGRILGGSSSINGMVWVRGNPADFDGWAAAGCTGWSWAEVEPVYRRIEAFEDPADRAMGHSGPIGITRGDTSVAPLNRAFMESAAQAGHRINPNHNGPDQLGFCAMHRNTRGGVRSDVYEGYLKPARTRANLTIRTGVQVERILVENGRATGVAFGGAGGSQEVRARREVLLCAGGLVSPQLLELSGIGDPQRLAGLGVDVIRALPGVGANLHTHPTVKLVHACTQPVSIYPWTRFPGTQIAGLTWLLRRSGPAASNHMEVGAFLKSRPECDRPDMQLTLVPIAQGGTYGAASGHGFEVYIELIGVRSRGEVHAASNNPRRPPEFTFNFLQDERDMAVMRRGTQVIRELVAQPGFAPYCGEELVPGAGVVAPEDVDAWLRGTVAVTHHIVGACRMGSADDPMAVVAPDLRVFGVEGLRVVDASIMPTVTSGNTHAPVIMIAERAADMIQGR